MKLKVNTKQIWTIFLCIGIIGNLIVNALYNMGWGDITKYNVFLWIFLMSISVVIERKIIQINLFKVLLTVMLFGILGNIHGSLLVRGGLSSLDNIIVNFLAMIVFIAIKGTSMDGQAIKQIMRILVICGITASVYAMMRQTMYLSYVFMRQDVAYNSWFYISFLGQRNIFAGYCFLSSIAALYLLTTDKKKKNKLYYIAIVLFGIQIYITNSRTALIAYLALIGTYLYLVAERKNRFFLSSIGILIVILLFQSQVFVDFLNTIFIHITSSGVDSASIRLDMWKGAVGYCIENIGMLFGFGIYPVSYILEGKFGYASTHNAYLDALLVGGIVYLCLTIYIYIQIYKRIKGCKDIHFSKVMMAAFIAFLLYNMTEAGIALFTQNYFSITSTILFVILPYAYNGCIERKREH